MKCLKTDSPIWGKEDYIMKNLKSLFCETADLATEELKDLDFQDAFDTIMKVRSRLFNEDPFSEIVRELISLGIIPEVNAAFPAEYYDLSYLYGQLSKAEVRLRQIKEYVHEDNRVTKMTKAEKAIEAARYGQKRMPKLLVPEWEI